MTTTELAPLVHTEPLLTDPAVAQQNRSELGPTPHSIMTAIYDLATAAFYTPAQLTFAQRLLRNHNPEQGITRYPNAASIAFENLNDALAVVSEFWSVRNRDKEEKLEELILNPNKEDILIKGFTIRDTAHGRQMRISTIDNSGYLVTISVDGSQIGLAESDMKFVTKHAREQLGRQARRRFVTAVSGLLNTKDKQPT